MAETWMGAMTRPLTLALLLLVCVPLAEAARLKGDEAASRLASRATFGMPYEAILDMADTGERRWLRQQFKTPMSSHDAIVDELVALQNAGLFDELLENNNNLDRVYRRLAWWHTTMTAEDQLRQRVAFALSEIFVVSDNLVVLQDYPYALSNYYDMLLTHAFGNYRDLLLAVTLHPTMGVYLSHLGNARSNPDANTFPDENYAREVMQLFSIGLFELNEDGTEKLDKDGQPIPTYDNTDIEEFAKIFTGLSFAGSNFQIRRNTVNFREPMQMYDAFHEPGKKTLLQGEVVPAGQSGLEDVEQAIDNLFNHPNVGPFFSKLLIQRLVMSNPSPAYVSRVAAAFNGEDTGVRGDMQAVIEAVLLDKEARAEPDKRGQAGKLREPLLRVVAALRQLKVFSPDGFYANTGLIIQENTQQHALSAPSVFNFYLPSHSPVGAIADAGLVAPEFQITNSSTIVTVSNMLEAALIGDVANDLFRAPFTAAEYDLSDFMPLAKKPKKLLKRIDLVMTYGTMSGKTRNHIRSTIGPIDDPDLRVRLALFLAYFSPDYAVEL
ncbi:MAG: DUF1800 family protein [Pseudomonadota bacterium]